MAISRRFAVRDLGRPVEGVSRSLWPCSWPSKGVKSLGSLMAGSEWV